MSENKEFELCAAKAFFASAWADACDESDNAVMLSGLEIFDVMPDTIDPAAIRAAKTLRVDMERKNGRSIGDMLGLIERDGDGDRDNTIDHFGHYSAMQAMGHGVGLYDAFGSDVHDAIKVPYVEFGAHSLEKDYF